ncbi:MAG: hypothetical protein ACRYHQ_32030 [Janthinobacterium lividum]
METTQQGQWAKWETGMAERKQPARQPGEMLSALLVAIADQRSRALPALDLEAKEMLLDEVRRALFGLYR